EWRSPRRRARSLDFLLSSSETISGSETRRACRKKYGDLVTTDQSLVTTLEQWRQRRARPTDAAGLSGATPDGASLHGAAACRPHAADDGVDSRSLFATGRAGGEALGEPRSFLRRRGAGDAPHPDGLRPHSEQGQARRRRTAGFVG